MSSGGGHHGSGIPLPFFDSFEAAIKRIRGDSGYGLNETGVVIAGLVILFFCFVFAPGIVGEALSIALFLTPLWLPYLLIKAGFSHWMIWRRAEFIASQQMMLLEIIPPRVIEKTPLAMETVFSGIHLAGGESTWWALYVRGSQRPWWSFEIASLEGKIHLYVWTRAAFRRQVESQIYSQYPGSQLVEVEDYTRTITAHQGEWDVWGCNYTKAKPDPYPIKTYVDFGLDKVAEAAEQTDPMANIIEFMGSLGKGEYMWLQIMIRVSKGDKYKGQKNASGKQYTWLDAAAEEIEAIRERAVKTRKSVDPLTGAVVETQGFPNPTKGQTETISAIERNVSKLAFDTGIRALYIAKPENQVGTTISGLSGLFKVVNSESLNTLKWTGGMLGFDDYPWEINVEKRKNHIRHLIVDAYRRRSYFYHPHEEVPFVMSTEELATIFHIPSGAVTTPSFARIQSQTSEAPAGLPI
jgi:hypothetical protein